MFFSADQVANFQSPNHLFNDYVEEWDVEPEIFSDVDYSDTLEELAERYQVTVSEFVETVVQMPNSATRRLENYSFDGRPYMRQIYDSQAPRILLMAGRQVEKCCSIYSRILMADGTVLRAKDVREGDLVATLDSSGTRMVSSRVSWVSERQFRKGVRVETRQGHCTEVAMTHPLRTWEAWTPASVVEAGDRIAVMRRAGEFTGTCQPPVERIRLTAYMIGDGHIGDPIGDPAGYLSFTSLPGEKLSEFLRDLETSGGTCKVRHAYSSRATEVRLHQNGQLLGWLGEDGLLGHNSDSKFVPGWVSQLSEKDTALFLNRLWATDGHVKQNAASKYSIEYCSTSMELVRSVQALLWKFGVPTCLRKNWPSYWKKRGITKYAYILRVETQDGVRSFLSDIAARGKSERVEAPTADENNNRDTYPSAVNALIDEIIESRGNDGRYGAGAVGSLYESGLRATPKYPPTRRKLQEYVDFFRKDQRYNQPLVDALDSHVRSDVYWDEVVCVSDVDLECVDFMIEGTHNFVVDGIVSHNTTLLGNRILALSCLIPHFKSLYVSPSSTQTKDFSKTRLKEAIETSPDLRTWWPPELTDNVYEKKAINRSEVKLRYAFLNADRCRGLSTDAIYIDEFQNILLDNIPVIEEAASHSPFKWFVYSGTPLSLDNPMQKYWESRSTQNEWAVPCEHHGTPKNPGSWHWNILGWENILPGGLSCDKCHAPISASHPLAKWVRTGTPEEGVEAYEGFRIPQLMVPWLEWSSIWSKFTSYPRAKFFNEVLGQSFDSGQRPLTKDDVIFNCDAKISLLKDALTEMVKRIGRGQIYAGIDWGQDTTRSYTVLSLGTYIDGFFKYFYVYRFAGGEMAPEIQMGIIMGLIDAFKIVRVGADYGGGLDRNDALLRKYGSMRISRFQYSNPSVLMDFDTKIGRWKIHRTEVMSAFFNAIKRRSVFRFPRWEEFQTPFASDLLAIFSEYDERTRNTSYKKSPNTTDDTFHSMLLCFLASLPENPRPDILVPGAMVDQRLFQ